MKAVNLKVEYLTNPVGIDITCPRFSWSFAEGTNQTAYQIVAKDDMGEILWDSGKVDSSKMHLVEWGGASLKSRARVIWTVTVWDDNNVAETSDEASFNLDLFKKGTGLQTGLQAITLWIKRRDIRWTVLEKVLQSQRISRC